jgi:peptidoglycan/LPS O-acetylase OafA/YrhL
MKAILTAASAPHRSDAGDNDRPPPWRLGHRPALDGLRGLAVLMVLWGHTRIVGDRAATLGVTLFFVLSGFLITSLLLEEREETGRINFPAFYVRRALRLLPALGLLIVIVGIVMVLEGRAGDLPADVVPAMFYFANWAAADGADLRYFEHTWSLSVEEQFYIVWPASLLFIITFANRWRFVLIAALIAASVAWRFFFAAQGDLLRWANGSDTRGDALLIGCLLALAISAGYRLPFRRVTVALVVIVMVMLSLVPDYNAMTYGVTVMALASALLVGWFVERPAGVLAWGPLMFVGRISYGLYLWQTPVISLWIFYIDGPLWARALWMFGVTFAVAVLSWRYVEAPALRLKRRWEIVRSGQGGPSLDIPDAEHGRVVRTSVDRARPA